MADKELNRRISGLAQGPGPVLFVTDLDGTLLDDRSRVSLRSCRLLNEAIDRGALFSVATARTPATVGELLAGVDMRVPAIVMTGAALWNPCTGRYSDVRRFPAQAARELVDLYAEMRFPAFVYTFSDVDESEHPGFVTNGVIDIYHLGPMSDAERKFLKARVDNPLKRDCTGTCCVRPWELPASFDPSHMVIAFALQPLEKVRAVYEAVRERKIPCAPLYYRDGVPADMAEMEVFAPGTSKAHALERLREMTGARRVVVFGDNRNDMPMMDAADIAVAPANAIPEVLEKADIVIGANTDDSVADFILRFTNMTGGH